MPEKTKWEQLDLELRQIVSKLLREPQHRKIAERINFARRQIFERLKAEKVDHWDIEELEEEMLDTANFSLFERLSLVTS